MFSPKTWFGLLVTADPEENEQRLRYYFASMSGLPSYVDLLPSRLVECGSHARFPNANMAFAGSYHEAATLSVLADALVDRLYLVKQDNNKIRDHYVNQQILKYNLDRPLRARHSTHGEYGARQHEDPKSVDFYYSLKKQEIVYRDDTSLTGIGSAFINVLGPSIIPRKHQPPPPALSSKQQYALQCCRDMERAAKAVERSMHAFAEGQARYRNHFVYIAYMEIEYTWSSKSNSRMPSDWLLSGLGNGPTHHLLHYDRSARGLQRFGVYTTGSRKADEDLQNFFDELVRYRAAVVDADMDTPEYERLTFIYDWPRNPLGAVLSYD